MPNQSDPNQPTASTPPAVAPPMDLPPLPQEFPGAQQNIQPPLPPAPSVDQGSAAPPETPPVTSNTPKKKFGGGRIIATILGLLLLVGGIGSGVYLTSHKQVLNSLASCGSCIAAGNQASECAAECNLGNASLGGAVTGGNHGCTGENCGATTTTTTHTATPAPTNPPTACQQCLNAGNTSSECSGVCGGGGVVITTSPPGGGTGGTSQTACQQCLNAGNTPTECNAVCGTGLGGGGNLGGLGTGGQGFGCIDSSVCTNGYTCQNGTCQGNPVTDTCGRNIDTNAPVCCTGACGGQIVCEGQNRLECLVNGTYCSIDTNGCTEGKPPAGTTTTGTAPACLNVKAYSSDWTALTSTELSKLTADTAVNFCVSGGNATFDKAMFKINSTTEPETTTKGQGAAAAAFCQGYTITAADIGTTVHVLAKIHDSTSSTWIGESF